MATTKITINVDEQEIFRSEENLGADNIYPEKDRMQPVVTNVFITGKDKNGNQVRVDIIDSVDLESIE
jgi:hypothetical protein